MRNLCIDIGNTRVKAAIYQDDVLQEHHIYEHDTDQWGSSLLVDQLDGIAISNVSDYTDFERFHHASETFVVLDEYTSLPFTNHYHTPATLGKDRLAAMLGAQALYPHTAVCVADIGTCVTLDYLTADGQYLGGNISPGVDLRLRAMHHFTDGLPLLEIAPTSDLLGKSTQDAMLHGAIDGLAYEIDGFLRRLENQFDQHITVLFTGGGAETFAQKLKREIFVHPFLLPYGLNYLLHHLRTL